MPRSRRRGCFSVLFQLLDWWFYIYLLYIYLFTAIVEQQEILPYSNIEGCRSQNILSIWLTSERTIVTLWHPESELLFILLRSCICVQDVSDVRFSLTWASCYFPDDTACLGFWVQHMSNLWTPFNPVRALLSEPQCGPTTKGDPWTVRAAEAWKRKWLCCSSFWSLVSFCSHESYNFYLSGWLHCICRYYQEHKSFYMRGKMIVSQWKKLILHLIQVGPLNFQSSLIRVGQVRVQLYYFFYFISIRLVFGNDSWVKLVQWLDVLSSSVLLHTFSFCY